MKTHALSQPRLACRLVRGWTTLFGDATAGEPRGFGAGHVATCEDCRRFYAACDELDTALKREAVHQMPVVSDGLEQRIIAAVRHSARKPRRRPTLYLPLALAGVAAGIGLTVLVIFQRQQPRPHRTTVAVETSQAAMAPAEVWTLLQPSAEDLLTGDPLQREVDAVVADARSAMRFLEQNFAPTQSAANDGRG